MTTLVIVEGLVAACVLILAAVAVSGSRRLKYAVADFGGRKANEGAEIRLALARQYMRQQSIAFGLVVAAVILGLVFSTTLLYRVFVASPLSLKDAARAVAIAADVFVGRYAFRSYKDASDRAEKLMKQIA